MVEKPQLFHQGDWLTKLNITLRRIGNVIMDAADVTELSDRIKMDALKAYRLAVGRVTRAAVQALQSGDVEAKSGSHPTVGAAGGWLRGGCKRPAGLKIGGGLTIAGLLLMPPTRHCLVHLNEALM
jgi:hypothetical protein